MVNLVANSLNWLNFGLPIVYVMFVLHLFQTMWELALNPPLWLQLIRLVRNYPSLSPVKLWPLSPAFVLWKFRLLCRLSGYMSITLRGWHNVVHNHSSRLLSLERMNVYATPLIARIPVLWFGTLSKPSQGLEMPDYQLERLRLTLESVCVVAEVFLYHLRISCLHWVLLSKLFATSTSNRNWCKIRLHTFLSVILVSRSSLSDDPDLLMQLSHLWQQQW